MKMLTTLALMIALATTLTAQDLKLPALSPTCTISQAFSTSKIEINYSRPSMRGRTIFGDLVPYDKVWRTGANAATKITFGEDVMIFNAPVAAGTYSLYTIPGKMGWQVIINKNTGNWGANGYDTKDDVVRLMMVPNTLANPVETFTIGVNNITFTSCTVDVMWDRTQLSIPITADNSGRIKDSIDKAMKGPNPPYQQAATYYNEVNQNLDDALVYATKAAEKNPKAYWVHMLRARIAVKLDNTKVAKQAAEATIEAAKGTDGEAEYTKAAQDLLNSLK